jgi:hypothetical protein
MSRVQIARVGGLLAISIVLTSGCAVRVSSISPEFSSSAPEVNGRGEISYTLVFDPSRGGSIKGTAWVPRGPDEPLPRWTLSARDDWKRLVARACKTAGYTTLTDVDVVGPDGQYHPERIAIAEKGRHLVVRLETGKNTFGSGAAYLTVFTLGLVPTWESWRAFTVVTQLYEDGSPQAAATHEVRSRDVAHLLMLPVFWLNFFLPSERDRIEEIIALALTAPSEEPMP